MIVEKVVLYELFGWYDLHFEPIFSRILEKLFQKKTHLSNTHQCIHKKSPFLFPKVRFSNNITYLPCPSQQIHPNSTPIISQNITSFILKMDKTAFWGRKMQIIDKSLTGPRHSSPSRAHHFLSDISDKVEHQNLY